MAGLSPTSRTLKYYREQGWWCQVVERWNPYARIRQDFAGICDIIGIKDDRTACIQATSASSTSAREKKILASDSYEMLKKAGCEIYVIGWGKYKVKRGGKKMIWKPKIKEM